MVLGRCCPSCWVEPVDFQHLDLQRHGQAVFKAAGAQANEDFSILLHGAVGHGLQTVEVGLSIGVGNLWPIGQRASILSPLVPGCAGG